jgi:hypothetical protein
MTRGQPSIEVAIDPEIAMGSIEVAKALCPGDVIQAKSFCAKQLLVVSTETGSGIVNGQDVGCVRVFVKAAAAKDQRALSELSPGYFEAGQHTVNLLRKAVRVAAPNVAAPAAAAPAVEAPAVEAPAEGPSEAAVEKTRSLAARSAALVARSAVIPVGTVVVLIMGAEVPQPVHAIKVSESGEDSWKVLGPTAGGWLHPHHNLGIGDQTHAASLPIYSFAEPPAHTAEAAGAEATGAKSASPDPGAVSLAMKTPLFTFMLRNASASNERLHFGPCPNAAFASQTDSTTYTVNIPKALRSTFSHTSTSAACVGSPLRSAKGTVILDGSSGGSSGGIIIGGGAQSKRSLAPDVPRMQPLKKKAKASLAIEVFDDLADDDRPPLPAAKRVKPGEEHCNERMVSIAEAKALSAAAASSAEAALYKDLVLQLREDAAARCAEINTATALLREHELKVGAQTMSLVSIFAKPRSEGRSPLAAPPVVYQRMGIEEACKAAAVKEAHATKLVLMATNHPEGGIVHSTLVKKAEEARAEAAGIMGAAF